METKTKIQIPNHIMKRSSSSNSESQGHVTHVDSPHSSLQFHSPLHSDLDDQPESPPFSAPFNSLENRSPGYNSKAIVSVNKYAPHTSLPRPANAAHAAAKAPPHSLPVIVVNREVREDGASDVRKVEPEWGSGSAASKMGEDMMKLAELGFRISGMVFCLISFSVMAADTTQGWSGDSFVRYKEFRYCLSVNVIAFAFSGFQAYDLSYHLVTGKHLIRHHLRRHFNFFMDQAVAYLLISASTAAATRVDDWQSNWGKDEFTEMITASVVMAFLAFIAFAGSSLISGYNLCN